MKKYEGAPYLVEKEFKRKFKDGAFVFVQDMSDLFADNVQEGFIRTVLEHIKKFPKATFLLLTKNPKRYRGFYIPDNCICGVTIESNYDFGVSKAPHPLVRYVHMKFLNHKRKMVSVEPVEDFDILLFLEMLRDLAPMFVYVGYDNYDNDLTEPTIEKLDVFIKELEKFTEVRVKPSVEKRRHA